MSDNNLHSNIYRKIPELKISGVGKEITPNLRKNHYQMSQIGILLNKNKQPQLSVWS